MAFVLLDACPGIRFQEQPARLTLRRNGKDESHVPDILVASRDRREFWECKSEKEADQFRIRDRTRCLAALLAPHGFGYRLITMPALQQAAYLANAIALRRYGREPLSDGEVKESVAAHQNHSAVPVELCPDQISRLYRLLYWGHTTTDFAQRITPASRTTPNHGGSPWVWQLFE